MGRRLIGVADGKIWRCSVAGSGVAHTCRLSNVFSRRCDVTLQPEQLPQPDQQIVAGRRHGRFGFLDLLCIHRLMFRYDGGEAFDDVRWIS